MSSWKLSYDVHKRAKEKGFEDNAVEQQWNETLIDVHWCCDTYKKICKDKRVMKLHKGVLQAQCLVWRALIGCGSNPHNGGM